jgi:hypothetical protein
METEGATVARQRTHQSEWFTTGNPDALLIALGVRPAEYYGELAAGRLSAPQTRRLRLFGCACARMVWDLLPTDARSAVAISERFASGQATESGLDAAVVRLEHGSVTPAQHALAAAGLASRAVYLDSAGSGPPVWNPIEAAREAAKSLASRIAGKAPPGGNPVSREWQAAYNAAFAEARAHQAELVRDIFPPTGYTPTRQADWLTDTVLALARQADESGDYSALPILADALQDAGCDDEIMLSRCRAESGIHSRGNWVVDLLLGRE